MRVFLYLRSSINLTELVKPFELLDEIEETLNIETYPMNWPVGMGQISSYYR